MRIKLNSFLQVFVIVAIFFIGGCGENGEQKSSATDTPQATQSKPAPPPALTDLEQKKIHRMLFNALIAVRAYSVENHHFPFTKAEMVEYMGKPVEGYDFSNDVSYAVTEKDGKIEEFVITVFNPTKTHRIDFESSCYKESGKCMENYQVRSMEKLLADSQIMPVE